MKTFEASRPGVAAMAVGVGRAAVEYARSTPAIASQFGRPIGQNQGVAFHAGRHGRIRRRGAPADLAGGLDGAGRTSRSTRAEGSMSKLVAGETAVRVTEQAIQILGGNGYTREYPVERWHRDAKIFTIFEGTSARSSGCSSGATITGLNVR
jgi:acyl-CoA dehydrogenase